MSRVRPTLGVYAPAPNSASGVADYAVSSSAWLSDLADVRCVTPDDDTSPTRFDHVLYHMSGGRQSVAAFRAAAIRPGPVILHEHVLSQFFVENHDLLDPDTNRAVRTAFGTALGREFDDSAALAELMVRERQLHYLDLGLERMVADRASVILTHSTAALATLRQRCGEARVRPLKFPVRSLDRCERGGVRAELGIPPTATVFGSFGFAGSHKRLPQLFEAWTRLNAPAVAGWLLVVGGGASRLRPLANRTTTVGEYVESGAEFRRLLSTVDIGVQLRGPTLGETSGVIAALLASDVPVITSTDSVLPIWANRDLVRIVPQGPAEIDELTTVLGDWLTRRPSGPGRRLDDRIPPWPETVLAALGMAPAARSEMGST
jgi:hypothetical protein